MNARIRNIVYSPLWLGLHALALLPFWMLYGVSDMLFLLVFYIVRYRRRLVKANIDASFPEKSEAERRKIARKFYRHFTDTFVETIKMLHISDAEMRRHITFSGVDAIDEYTRNGKSVAVYAAHYGNWEWITSITLWAKYLHKVQYAQIYRPLRNKWFDEFYYKLRQRFHSESIPKNGVLRSLLRYRRDGTMFVTGFISDQKPSHNDGLHHVEFLHQDTPFITGTELLLRKLDTVVMCFDMRKIKRGHYHADLVEITPSAAGCKEFEITDKFASLLEAAILRQPELWLWSHNRWRRPLK